MSTGDAPSFLDVAQKGGFEVQAESFHPWAELLSQTIWSCMDRCGHGREVDVYLSPSFWTGREGVRAAYPGFVSSSHLTPLSNAWLIRRLLFVRRNMCQWRWLQSGILSSLSWLLASRSKAFRIGPSKNVQEPFIEATHPFRGGGVGGPQ